MKRNKDINENAAFSNGITITDSISLTIKSKYWINSKLLLIIVSLVGIIGFILSFLSLYELNCDKSAIFISQAAVIALCTVISMFPSKAKYLLIPVYAIFGYLMYQMRFKLTDGYAVFINKAAVKLKLIAEGHSYYRIPKTVNQYECLTLFLVFFFSLITAIIIYNTIVKPRFLLVFSCTFPFIEAGLLFGFSPDHQPFSLLISYWISLFAMRMAGNQYHSSSGQPVFIRKRNLFVSSGNLRNNVIEDIGIITITSVFAIIIISSACLKIFSYHRPEKINETRHSVKSAISELSIEKIANKITDEADQIPVNNKSRLGNISKISFKGRTDISVIMSERPLYNTYIKGFVGSEYSNNTWYAMDDIVYEENSDLFDKFDESNIFPQCFNTINNRTLSKIYPENFRNIHMLVSSKFKSSSYLFAPYSLDAAIGIFPDKDAFFVSENMNEYSFYYYSTPNLYKNLYFLEKENLCSDPEFTKIEREYRDFAYSQYAGYSAPNYNQIFDIARENNIPEYNGENLDKIYESIKSVLHSNAEYSLEPGKTPANEEITHYLLTENHKGYCSHFATAGTVLARISGVPARYAEGYVIIPSDFDNAENINNYYKIDIQDSRAHAWTEFYIDGYGWIPFEFTPGYDLCIISAEEILKSDSTQTSIVEVTVPEQTTIVTRQEPDSSTQTTSAAVTEVPSQTTVPSTEKHPSENDGTQTRNPAFIIIIKILLSVLLLVSLFVLIIIVRHVICIRSRILGFRCKSNNKSIANVYKYVLKLLSHIGIYKGNMLPLDFAEYADEKSEQFTHDGMISEIIRLALKAGFSNEEVTSEELRYAIKIAYELSDNIYNSKSRYGQLVFKYILNLSK